MKQGPKRKCLLLDILLDEASDFGEGWSEEKGSIQRRISLGLILVPMSDTASQALVLAPTEYQVKVLSLSLYPKDTDAQRSNGHREFMQRPDKILCFLFALS